MSQLYRNELIITNIFFAIDGISPDAFNTIIPTIQKCPWPNPIPCPRPIPHPHPVPYPIPYPVPCPDPCPDDHEYVQGVIPGVLGKVTGLVTGLLGDGKCNTCGGRGCTDCGGSCERSGGILGGIL